MKPAGTQQDRNMNFDGMESMAPSKSSKYQTNTWSGHMNDGREVNMGRAPQWVTGAVVLQASQVQ